MLSTTSDARVIALHYPLGLLLAGGASKVWVRVNVAALLGVGAMLDPTHVLRGRWLKEGSESAPSFKGALWFSKATATHIDGEFKLEAPLQAGDYTLEVDIADPGGARVGQHCESFSVTVSAHSEARAAVMTHVHPLSYAWGTDRGLPPHRYYLERFLTERSADVKGRCLEFQNPSYARQLGGERITRLDILHVDDTSPWATMVGDLTKPNDIPSECFDCIICTHVLHMIFDVELAVRDLHRILKPKGVLLVGVPHVSAYDPRIGEFWRFTVEGLDKLLTRCFPGGTVETRGLGNSLVAAGDLRGMTVNEFTESELAFDDPFCPVEVCGRAVKAGES